MCRKNLNRKSQLLIWGLSLKSARLCWPVISVAPRITNCVLFGSPLRLPRWSPTGIREEDRKQLHFLIQYGFVWGSLSLSFYISKTFYLESVEKSNWRALNQRAPEESRSFVGFWRVSPVGCFRETVQFSDSITMQFIIEINNSRSTIFWLLSQACLQAWIWSFTVSKLLAILSRPFRPNLPSWTKAATLFKHLFWNPVRRLSAGNHVGCLDTLDCQSMIGLTSERHNGLSNSNVECCEAHFSGLRASAFDQKHLMGCAHVVSTL